jgi:octaheme c-type cytochrome (tetrathionate reductase family)
MKALIRCLQAAFAAVVCLVGVTALAAENHAKHLKGPFTSGPEVTKACLECHDQEAKHFMGTVHWTWSARQKTADGREVELGKANAINNYCIALPSNEARCTSCHAGYGWKDRSFDLKKAENVDCLVCHDTTGTYKKLPAGAGHPAYKDMELPPGSGKITKAVDLLAVAQKVGPTSRATCGACHFFGGGGDHVKHGDLDSSLTRPTRQMDVHMAVDEGNMQCTACHEAKNHVIPGKALSVSTSGGARTLDCSSCHAGRPHKLNAELNRHTERVACQTCHIPTFARTLPTKTWWDWSTAGKDGPVPKDADGQPLYDKMKGDFRWAKDIQPTYLWFNGSVERYIAGDKMDPQQVTALNKPLGSRADKSAKITPFKVMRGKQPYDAGNDVFAVPHLFGGYWNHYDWNKAIADGMTAAGLPYSGRYGFAPTVMYWKVNHMVTPKQQALACDDCHRPGGRMDWKALGYAGDPRAAR